MNHLIWIQIKIIQHVAQGHLGTTRDDIEGLESIVCIYNVHYFFVAT